MSLAVHQIHNSDTDPLIRAKIESAMASETRPAVPQLKRKAELSVLIVSGKQAFLFIRVVFFLDGITVVLFNTQGSAEVTMRFSIETSVLIRHRFYPWLVCFLWWFIHGSGNLSRTTLLDIAGAEGDVWSRHALALPPPHPINLLSMTDGSKAIILLWFLNIPHPINSCPFCLLFCLFGNLK